MKKTNIAIATAVLIGTGCLFTGTQANAAEIQICLPGFALRIGDGAAHRVQPRRPERHRGHHEVRKPAPPRRGHHQAPPPPPGKEHHDPHGKPRR